MCFKTSQLTCEHLVFRIFQNRFIPLFITRQLHYTDMYSASIEKPVLIYALLETLYKRFGENLFFFFTSRIGFSSVSIFAQDSVKFCKKKCKYIMRPRDLKIIKEYIALLFEKYLCLCCSFSAFLLLAFFFKFK